MEKVIASDADQVSEALVIWVGPVPNLGYDRDPALVDRFGAQLAAKLLPVRRALQENFSSMNAGDVADGLNEMHKLAFDEHPEISDDAAHAFATKYTYANR